MLGDWATNCYVVERGSDCIIVDCGFDPEPMIRSIEERSLSLQLIVLTHAHLDHIGGLDEVSSRYPSVPVVIHERERGFCSDPMLNLSVLAGMSVRVREPDHFVKGGETIPVLGTEFRVLHTPGHSPGGITLVHDPSRSALVGDTLFAGSIGRTDFPTSDPDQMRRTLREILMSLPDEYRVYPGHGPSTTIGRERATNPWLLEMAPP